MAKTKSISVRLSDKATERLERLKEKMEMNATSVIQEALKCLEQRELGKPSVLSVSETTQDAPSLPVLPADPAIALELTTEKPVVKTPEKLKRVS